MNVTLKCFANIRDIVGKKELPVDLIPGATLSDLFGYLQKAYGKNFDRQVTDQLTGELVPFLILINDKAFRSVSDMETPLNDGDIITIMIPFDGG